MHVAPNLLDLPRRVAAALLLALLGTSAAAAPAEIRGRAITYYGSRAGILVVVDRGADHGVVVGDIGQTASGPCRVIEVYAFRSRCVLASIDHDAQRRSRDEVVFLPPPPEPARTLAARVRRRVAEEDGVSLLLDVGYAAGARLDDRVVAGGRACRVFWVAADAAWCRGAPELGEPAEAEVTVTAPAGRTLSLPIQARPRRSNGLRPPDDPAPPAGRRAPAPPLAVERVSGSGLEPSRWCLGFTTTAAYVVEAAADAGSDPPYPEAGLEVQRIDFVTGRRVPVLALAPGRPAEATRRIAALAEGVRLDACHDARVEEAPSAGAPAWSWLADHGAGGVARIWIDGRAVWAADGAARAPREVAPTPPDARGEPSDASAIRVLYAPGVRGHLVDTTYGVVMVTLDVAP